MDMTDFRRDTQGGLPLFRQLAKFFISQIDQGALSPGDQLPTEREIAEQTGLSRGTVRPALALLEQTGYIKTRQGSGSLVLPRSPGKASIAIFGSSQETLLDLKHQLDERRGVQSTIFILESLRTAPDPQAFLAPYDLALVPNHYYREIAALLGDAAHKLIEISPLASRATLDKIFALDRGARLGIICKSNEFLAAVKGTLVTYGFSPDNILSFFEMDYTTSTYFPGGIDALISFASAHIFTNERFRFRNEEFIAKGGEIILFSSQLEEACLEKIKA